MDASSADLIQLAFSGDTEALQTFLSSWKPADQSAWDSGCFEAAYQAANMGHREAVRLLLGSIADEDFAAQCRKNCAQKAATEQRWSLLMELIDTDNTSVPESVRNECCNKAVTWAAGHGNQQVLIQLLDCITDVKVREEAELESVVSAALEGQTGTVLQLLLRAEGSPEYTRYCSEAVIYAAQQGQSATVREVLRLGLVPPLEHPTVLFFLANEATAGKLHNVSAIAESLPQDQLAPWVRDCIASGHVSLALGLLAHLSDPDTRSHDSRGLTLLMFSADRGQHELIAALLDRGASVDLTDEDGDTALARACARGHARAVQVLLERGADPKRLNRRGLSSRDLARQAGKWDIFMLLGAAETALNEEAYSEPGASSSIDSPSSITADPGSTTDEQLSLQLHQLLSEAGFTEERAKFQIAMATFVETCAVELTETDRRMTGSYSDGWGNSLVQVNGRTAADSDIDWTVLLGHVTFHLEGSCQCEGEIARLPVVEGHAVLQVLAGSNPAIAAPPCGVRPAQDTCYAYECCGTYCEDRIEKLTPGLQPEIVHLVRATRPNCSNELRVSFSFEEKSALRQLSTVQGQLFILLKFIFKRLLPRMWKTPGLKTYNAKTLLFFMLERHPQPEDWKPERLAALMKESLDLMLQFLNANPELPDVCMPHFFMAGAPLFFKNAGMGGPFARTKERVRACVTELRADVGQLRGLLSSHMRPLESPDFYFHPFTILPLVQPYHYDPLTVLTWESSQYTRNTDIYCLLYECLTELQSQESCSVDSILKRLWVVPDWALSAKLCLKVMTLLKDDARDEAIRVISKFAEHSVKRSWPDPCAELPDTVLFDSDNASFSEDWIWRCCYYASSQPRFNFLPDFTGSLMKFYKSDDNRSYYYINFRCLWWSLLAEYMYPRDGAASFAFQKWFDELQVDPDLEELLTLAHYSVDQTHLRFCVAQAEELCHRRLFDSEDLTKIELVKDKLRLLEIA